ncbi:hypothetical protein HMPREF1862_01943 [Varibaculum cambriense]|uniref:Uncharacterized protein n=1 Tax=Varibaculum cambriense TaxID=184870 RepID=A0AB34WXI3_9ACTO|nr:hypothetical protein HMPREF1862_01943 [Varibaculum cambriense]
MIKSSGKAISGFTAATQGGSEGERQATFSSDSPSLCAAAFRV